LKIAILSSAPRGGAGIAAKRLCDAIKEHTPHQSLFIDIASINGEVPSSVIVRDSASNKLISDTHFTGETQGYIRGWMIRLLSAYDFINAHWCSYLMTISELIELARLNKKILLTMHDFNYITGGCHYPSSCNNFMSSCLKCPQVNELKFEQKNVHQSSLEKSELLSYPNVQISAPSKFILSNVNKAMGIDNDRLHLLRNPISVGNHIAEHKEDAILKILLISDAIGERRKGMQLAIESLNELKKRGLVFSLILVGESNESFNRAILGLDPKAEIVGRISDQNKLNQVYDRSNLILTCSYEDNWPNILVEAGVYGVLPVVGPGHGCAEFVSRYGLGSVSIEYTAKSFANALEYQIKNRPSLDQRRKFIMEIINEHSPKYVASIYLDIIKSFG
jgi:glycosyltransferase involved in cell wall biosynthesis